MNPSIEQQIQDLELQIRAATDSEVARQLLLRKQALERRQRNIDRALEELRTTDW